MASALCVSGGDLTRKKSFPSTRSFLVSVFVVQLLNLCLSWLLWFLRFGCISQSPHDLMFEVQFKHWAHLPHGGMVNTLDLGNNLHT